MNWLVLSYFLSLGTLSYTGQTFDAHGAAMFVTPDLSFQTKLGVEAQAFDNHFFIGGSVETWESPNGQRFFSPSEGFYVFSLGLRGWGFELGYRHECDHPIETTFGNIAPTQGIGVIRDEFYLSFSGNVKVF